MRAEFPQRQAPSAVEYLNFLPVEETNVIQRLMKTLLAVAIATVLVGSAFGQSGSREGQPVGPKTTGPGAFSPANSPFRKWTTAQLQQRRLDLYRQIPQTQTNLPGHR